MRDNGKGALGLGRGKLDFKDDIQVFLTTVARVDFHIRQMEMRTP